MEVARMNSSKLTSGRSTTHVMDRIMGKIEITATNCWLHLGPKTNGYGRIEISRNGVRKTLGIHKVVYENLVGEVPNGLELDHLCRNRPCCNPMHLEPVTHAENVRRGLSPGQIADFNARKTHCPAGHPFDKENTYVWSGSRHCRICRKNQVYQCLKRKKNRNVTSTDYYRGRKK